MLKGLLFKPDAGSFTELAIDREFELEELYKALECDTIDIVVRKIAGEYYDIVCDDEGALKDDRIISAINSDGYVMLFGNLFICHHEGPELASLTDEDVPRIMSAVRMRRKPLENSLPSLPLGNALLVCNF